jgi:PadR family transcriptional regulator PadR
MTQRKTNPAFLNGVPEMLLLQLLARRPMYGYELVEAIKVATGGSLEFGEGCVYPILHRLESQKVLAANRENVAGRTRVVYRCTPKGKAQLARSISNWQRVTSAIGQALKGGQRGRAALAS